MRTPSHLIIGTRLVDLTGDNGLADGALAGFLVAGPAGWSAECVACPAPLLVLTPAGVRYGPVGWWPSSDAAIDAVLAAGLPAWDGYRPVSVRDALAVAALTPIVLSRP